MTAKDPQHPHRCFTSHVLEGWVSSPSFMDRNAPEGGGLALSLLVLVPAEGSELFKDPDRAGGDTAASKDKVGGQPFAPGLSPAKPALWVPRIQFGI